jgi:hypothetical protein
VTKLDELLSRLEARIAEAEAELRSLRQENASLRSAHAAEPGADARPVRLAVLEAERQEVQSRLRSLLEAL